MPPEQCEPVARGEMADLLAACLDKDPGGRPAAREVAATLQPMVGALPRKLVLGRRGAAFR